MARADTYTWLSLDEWAMILGYNIWHFNSIDLTQGNCDAADCDRFWFQYPFEVNRTSREELAGAIYEAEQSLATYLKYNLMPDWSEETVPTERHHDPLLTSNINSRRLPKSVQLKKRLVWAGGVRASAAISEGVSVVRSDEDGDNYDETATITVDLSDYNSDEVRVFYPGKKGSPKWEIRPVTIDGNTITFPVWLIVKPSVGMGPTCSTPLDPNDDIYLDTVDVYRVYNDTSVQAELIYEPDNILCNDDNSCVQKSVGNCIYTEDEELGYVVYNSKLYSEPDKVKIYYYSGWYDGTDDRPKSELDEYWKRPIAYFAAGLLDKEIHNYTGGNSFMLISRWMEEMSNSKEFRATEFMLNNPFGVTTRGAYYAYNKARLKRTI